MSSLEQANQINKNGVYKINGKARNSDKLDDWISLETEFVQPQHTDQTPPRRPVQRRKFAYDELNKLKSMVMLLAKRTATPDAPDNDNDMLDYFIDVFDSVTRMAETFVKLANRGCTLFEEVVVTVYADMTGQRMREKKPLVELQLVLPGCGFEQTRTFVYQGEPLLTCLKNFCRLLDTILAEWCKHVELIRNTYTFINLFDIKQINLLRSTITKLISSGQIEPFARDQLESLLSSLIRPDTLTNQVLSQIYEQSRQQIRRLGNTVEDDFAKEFALQNGLDEALVRRGVALYGRDEDRLTAFCIINDTDMTDSTANECK